MNSLIKHKNTPYDTMQRSSLKYLLLFLVSAMILNFFLTPNPYSALHAGKAAYSAVLRADEFSLHVGKLITIVLFVTCIFTVHPTYKVDKLVILACTLLIASGMQTELIYSRPQPYLFEIASFVSLSFIAANDLTHKTSINLKWFYCIALVLFAAGLACVALQPNRWGKLPFSFSRGDRGEVTLWEVTGLYLFLPLLTAQLLFHFRPILRPFLLFIWLCMLIIAASTATRVSIYFCLAPIVFYFILRLKPERFIGKELVILIIGTCVVGLCFSIINNYDDIILYVDETSSGRFDLWRLHYDRVLDNPIWGSGAFLIEREHVVLRGTSEVGILRSFSEYGVFWGLFQTFVILVATIKSVVIIRRDHLVQSNTGRDAHCVFCALCVLVCAPDLVQNHSRILSVVDLAFWYSVLYINYLGPISSSRQPAVQMRHSAREYTVAPH